MVLVPAASGTRGATSAAVIVRAPSVGRQLAPEWPCLAAMIWHSRLQNHALRHRPQRSSLHPSLPHASHVFGAIAEAAQEHAAPRVNAQSPEPSLDPDPASIGRDNFMRILGKNTGG